MLNFKHKFVNYSCFYPASYISLDIILSLTLSSNYSSKQISVSGKQHHMVFLQCYMDKIVDLINVRQNTEMFRFYQLSQRYWTAVRSIEK